ncbi:MAG: hypothetical protein KAJ19_15265 [Gammaproteobacteria bacterium]|nr:hypothetical protein [Gammaproteobacteria bacterium]
MTDLANQLRAKLVPEALPVPTAAPTQGAKPQPQPPEAGPGAPEPPDAPKDNGDPKKAIWAARMPGSAEYLAGPGPLDVVMGLISNEHEVVNTETGYVVYGPPGKPRGDIYPKDQPQPEAQPAEQPAAQPATQPAPQAGAPT